MKMSYSVDLQESAASKSRRTDWQSISVGSAVCFLATFQHAVYISSMWPYLLMLLPSAREDVFGYTVMMSPLFQGLVSPLYGYWCNRSGRTKEPVICAVLIMALGNIIYLLLPLNLADPNFMMGLSRAILGAGGGIFTATRVNAVECSRPADRSRALSANSGAFALGCCAGPALQLAFEPLSYPGIKIFGFLRFNIYTGPAFSGILCCIISMILLTLYRDSNVEAPSTVNEQKEEVLPPYDKTAAAVCIYTRFVQYFVFAILEGIGTSYAMNMFSWSKERAIYWMATMHLGSAAVEAAITAGNLLFNVGARWNQRLCALLGLSLLLVFLALTFQWWFIPGSVDLLTAAEEALPGVEATGCRVPDFWWCSSMPAVSPVLFISSFVICLGTGFALLTISNAAIYSFVIGPHKQGFMQSWMTVAVSAARVAGPVIISWLYVHTSPRPAWLLEIAALASCIVLSLLFHRRLVPLVIPIQPSTTESSIATTKEEASEL